MTSKLRDEFEKTILTLRPAESAALIRAFEVIRGYGREAARVSGAEYSTLVRDLLTGGLPESAAAVFAICVDSIASVPAEFLINASAQSQKSSARQ